LLPVPSFVLEQGLNNIIFDIYEIYS
jgi:hypothetical protein